MAIARLRDGVTTEQAEAQLQSLRGDWAQQHPDHYAKGHFAVLRPLHEDVIGDQGQALMLLSAAVVCVLVIVCVNLAALLVSRSEARRRDFAVRMALGASRGRLLKLLLSEAMLLSVLGGVLGLLLGQWLLAALVTLYPEQLPAGQTVAIGWRTIGVSAIAMAITGMVLGIVPALHAVRPAPARNAEGRCADRDVEPRRRRRPLRPRRQPTRAQRRACSSAPSCSSGATSTCSARIWDSIRIAC